MDMAKDPREMRKEIDESIRARFCDDRPFSHSANLVHIADSAAYHLGWSGEDRMTAIAYLALKQVDELTDRLIEQVNVAIPRGIVSASDRPPNENNP